MLLHGARCTSPIWPTLQAAPRVQAPSLACSKGDDCPKCHNRIELLYHPQAFKQRFCSSWPHIENCSRGNVCAFAHARDEARAAADVGLAVQRPQFEAADMWKRRDSSSQTIPCSASEVKPVLPPHLLAGSCSTFLAQVAAPLFTLEEESGQLSGEFFMHKFKTLWCPLGVQHDWHRCLYAHTSRRWGKPRSGCRRISKCGPGLGNSYRILNLSSERFVFCLLRSHSACGGTMSLLEYRVL